MTPLHPDDTIAALSSAPGPGLRAILRVTGPAARTIVSQHFHPSSDRSLDRRGRFVGELRIPGVHSPLPVVVYVWVAPRSYTGQDLVEIHTLSSPPLLERILAELMSAGARPAQPGEFTLRAFLAGKKDLTQAEAVHAVIEASTVDDLQQALGQLAGGIALPLHKLRDDLLNLLADIEAGLDFVDEDIQFVQQDEVLVRVGGGMAHLTNLRRQLESRGVSGPAVRVVLAGAPNAGKSSLFNALAGSSAALVSPEAGTTRDYLVHRLTLGGLDVDLIDTAGRQSAQDSIETQAQHQANEQTRMADLVLWCVPSDEPVTIAAQARTLLIRTKADLPDPPETASGWSTEIRASVVTPTGLEELRTALTEHVRDLRTSALAPSLSRCRHHLEEAIAGLKRAHEHALYDDPPELLALALREVLTHVGTMAGTVYTNDLLDRIFSRFCIGK